MTNDGSRPLVSVVVTCYNYGRFLDACLGSVLAQDYPNLEVVLVDDGSTDETPAIARRWTDAGRVLYVRQENSGQARAKNEGIRRSHGELVAFLDADDAWEPGKLARQVPLFSDPTTGVVYSRSRFIDEDGHDAAAPYLGPHLEPRRGAVTEHLVFDNFVPFSSSVVRRSCLAEVGGFDDGLAMAIDWDLWLRMSRRWRFDFVDAPLIRYRVGHADQMSRQRETRVRCCDQILSSFLEQNRGLVSRRTLRDALSYSYVARGQQLDATEPWRAVGYYLRAIQRKPLQVPAYKGLIRATLFGGRSPLDRSRSSPS